MASALKFGELSPGELLWLSRKRTGENHEAAAARLGMHPETYLRLEWDKATLNPPDLSNMPELVPTAAECCVIARRRWNRNLPRYQEPVTQTSLATILGVTRIWICRMERGRADCTRLQEYWLSNMV